MAWDIPTFCGLPAVKQPIYLSQIVAKYWQLKVLKQSELYGRQMGVALSDPPR